MLVPFFPAVFSLDLLLFFYKIQPVRLNPERLCPNHQHLGGFKQQDTFLVFAHQRFEIRIFLFQVLLFFVRIALSLTKSWYNSSTRAGYPYHCRCACVCGWRAPGSWRNRPRSPCIVVTVLETAELARFLRRRQRKVRKVSVRLAANSSSTFGYSFRLPSSFDLLHHCQFGFLKTVVLLTLVL